MAALPGRLAGTLTDCGYLVLAVSPRLRSAYSRWARRRYARLAGAYAGHVGANALYLGPLQRLLEALPITPQRIVEIGAGTGVATEVLRRAYPTASLVAVDASLPMLSQLWTIAPDAIVRVAGDAFTLPLRSGVADLVIVHNAPFDLRELGRVAAPSGTVVVVLSSAQGVPAVLREWSMRRHQFTGWICAAEYRAGSGIAWVFRRRMDQR